MAASPFLIPMGWRITSWTTKGTVVDGIPDNSFQVDSTMLIALETPTSYGLYWLDQNQRLCSASGLQFQEPSTLNGDGIPVNFGGKTVACFLTVMSTGQSLTGDIDLDAVEPARKKVRGGIGMQMGPDTGSGTFTAIANAPPPIFEPAHAGREPATR